MLKGLVTSLSRSGVANCQRASVLDITKHCGGLAVANGIKNLSEKAVRCLMSMLRQVCATIESSRPRQSAEME